MANLWRIAREWMQSQNPHRNIPPPKLSSVLEILQTQEEARDHVYYDALRRISASSKSEDYELLTDTVASVYRPNLEYQFVLWANTFHILLAWIHFLLVFDEKTTHVGNGACADCAALGGITEEEEESSSYSRRGSVVRYAQSVGESIQEFLSSEILVLDPEDDAYYLWMGVVAAIVIYNFWTVILGIAFTETSDESFSRVIFWWGDLFADGLYACDICVQLRTAYRDDHGIMVRDPEKLREKYYKKRGFKADIICLLPLESLSSLIFFPCDAKFLRLPRLLKWHSVGTFFLMSDYRTSKPNRLRAFKLILYLSVAMHWVACLYYTLSEYEGLGSNEWVYCETEKGGDSFTRKYVKSFYWSVLTLMTIGETPSPQTNIEYIFTGFMFLLGIFVFATVVGNVGDVISNMNAPRTNFQARMDSIKQFMEHHNVPQTLQTRVKRWAHYAWSRTQALDESSSLEMLPDRLRTEIAIHVHLDTLRKVKIFKDCEQGLLCELVLKLRPQIFSPGDYICRSGEIGREMYIINNGRVEVVITDSSTNEEVVVASLTEGNYFGEISLLRLDEGKNRRSADVRSVGYSELLCLSQKDLMEALEEYPDAKKVLESQGRDRLQRTRAESSLSVPGPGEANKEKLHDLEFNFAREINSIKKLLEELKENKQECLYLRAQVLRQGEELCRIRQQVAIQNRSPSGGRRKNKSSGDIQSGERLIQRLILAAKLASENLQTSQEKQASEQRNEFDNECKSELKEHLKIAENVPDIYLESDIDGLCYLGPRRRSLKDDNNNT